MSEERLPQEAWDIADWGHVVLRNLQHHGVLQVDSLAPGSRPRVTAQSWLRTPRCEDGETWSEGRTQQQVFNDAIDLWFEIDKSRHRGLLLQLAVPYILADLCSAYEFMPKGIEVGGGLYRNPGHGVFRLIRADGPEPVGPWIRLAREIHRYRILRRGICSAHEMSTLTGLTYQHVCSLLRKGKLAGSRIHNPAPEWQCIAASAVAVARDPLGRLDEDWKNAWRSYEHHSHVDMG